MQGPIGGWATIRMATVFSGIVNHMLVPNKPICTGVGPIFTFMKANILNGQRIGKAGWPFKMVLVLF